MKILPYLERQSKSSLVFIGFLLIVVTGVVDFLSGYEYSFSVFYVLPIALITWSTNKKIGSIACMFSAIVWLGAEVFSGKTYHHEFVPVWNTLIRFSLFLLIAILLSTLRVLLEQERTYAYTDFLTSVVNSRYFYQLIEVEFNRSSRSQEPLTLAYIDIDNFKKVNDNFGHAVGDELLKAFVETIKLHIRKTDVVARLGGDEFAILFPNTDQEGIKVVILKIQETVKKLLEEKQFPITFSMGVVTFATLPSQSDELIKVADNLMYTVKSEGKNAVRYFVYDG